jgi:hypothetical protein
VPTSPDISEALNRADFVSLTLCASGSEWQASLEVTRGAFRIRVAASPAEALGAVLGLSSPVLLPPPY